MVLDYIYWHYVVVPAWLMQFYWNIQRALARYFSLPTMLRTLVAHWHRDAMPYHGGRISTYFNIFLLNTISRAIGFFIRTLLILIWAVSATLALFASAGVLVCFLFAPLIVVILASVGVVFLYI